MTSTSDFLSAAPARRGASAVPATIPAASGNSSRRFILIPLIRASPRAPGPGSRATLAAARALAYPLVAAAAPARRPPDAGYLPSIIFTIFWKSATLSLSMTLVGMMSRWLAGITDLSPSITLASSFIDW